MIQWQVSEAVGFHGRAEAIELFESKLLCMTLERITALVGKV